MFGDTSGTIYSNKRFNKKYSRFLLGDSVNRSSTLFRGVKFEIVEYNGSKEEIFTGKYNDYKFSFIYIPVWGLNDNDNDHNEYKVYFVKNDDYKFVVGFMFFDMKDNPKIREFTFLNLFQYFV